MAIVALVENKTLHGLWIQHMLKKGKQVYALSHLEFWHWKQKISHVLIWRDRRAEEVTYKQNWAPFW